MKTIFKKEPGPFDDPFRAYVLEIKMFNRVQDKVHSILAPDLKHALKYFFLNVNGKWDVNG